MELEAVLGIVVFASMMGIWAGAAISKVIGYNSGTEVAERFNTAILVGIGLLVFVYLVGSFILPLFDIPDLDMVILGMAFIYLVFAGLIVGGVVYIIWKRRQITADSLLLDAGRNVHGLRLLIGGYFLLQIGYGLIKSLANGQQLLEENPVSFSSAIFMLVALVAWFMSSYEKVYLTRQGISLFRLTTVKWEQIQAYIWSVRPTNKVSLILKGGRRVEFTVDKERKEEVESIFQAKVKGQEETVQTRLEAQLQTDVGRKGA